MKYDYTAFLIQRPFLDACYEVTCETSFGKMYFLEPVENTDRELFERAMYIQGFTYVPLRSAIDSLVAMFPYCGLIDVKTCRKEIFECIRKRININSKHKKELGKWKKYSRYLLTNSGNALKNTQQFDALGLILAVSMLQHLISKKASHHGDFMFFVEPPSGI